MNPQLWLLSECLVVGAMCPLELDAEFSSARVVFARREAPHERLIHRGTEANGELRGDPLTAQEWAGLLESEEALAIEPVAVDRPVVAWVFRSATRTFAWWAPQLAALEQRAALVQPEAHVAAHALVCLVDPRKVGTARKDWADQLHEQARAALQRIPADFAEALRLARRAFCVAPSLDGRDVAMLALAYELNDRAADRDGVLGMARRTGGDEFHARVLAIQQQLGADFAKQAPVEIPRGLLRHGGPSVPRPDPERDVTEKQVATPLGLEAIQIRERVRAELFGESRDQLRYQIGGKLGSGGMGVVYQAHDTELDCTVALKQLHADLAADTRLVERLRREARAMARLRGQKHVVNVFDCFSQGDAVFVVMELVAGTTLRQWQQTTPRPWREVLEMYLQAGDGLRAAHEAGLVHRDFKPDNVLLTREAVPKVADFGLAHEPGPSATPATPGQGYRERLHSTRHGMGTLRYMAPEQLAGGRVDARADQYSFCVALHEALFSRHPVLPLSDPQRTTAAATDQPDGAQPGTDQMLIAAILRGELLPLTDPGPVPGVVLRALHRGLDRRPEGRFDTMQDLLTALRAALPTDAAPVPRRSSTLVRTLMAAGLLVAAAGGAIGVHYWSRSQPTAEPTIRYGAAPDRELSEALAGLRARVEAPGPGASQAGPALVDELERSIRRWAIFDLERRLAREVSSTHARCLVFVREELLRLTTTLRDADEPDFVQAEARLAALPDSSDCRKLDEREFGCRVDETADGSPAEAQALEFMREAERLELGGDYPGAIAAARAAADSVEGSPLANLRARAHYLHGRLLQEAEQPEQALAALKRAMEAAEAEACLYLRADIASRLVKVTAQNPSLPLEQAKVWSDTQMNLAKKISGDPWRVAQAHAERGLLALMREHDPGRAVAELTEARYIRTRALAGRPSADQADTLRNLAIAYRQLGEFAQARGALEAAIAEHEAVYGKDHSILYLEMHELGLLAIAQGPPSDPMPALDRGLALAQRGYPGDTGPVATLQFARAEALYALERIDEALEAARQAEARAEAATMDPTIRFEIRAGSAALLGEGGSRDAAIAALGELLREAEVDSRVDLEARAAVGANLAEVLYAIDRYPEAEGRASEALGLLAFKRVPPDHPTRVQALLLRGKTRYLRDDLDEAITDLERVLELIPTADSRDRAEAGVTLLLALKQRRRNKDGIKLCTLLPAVEEDVRRVPVNDMPKLLRGLRKACRGPLEKNRGPG